MSEQQEKQKMFIVSRTDNKYLSHVLSIHDSYNSAISYLNSYIDEQYNTSTSNKFCVKQKSKNLYEVYQNSYFYKYFEGKYQILEVEK